MKKTHAADTGSLSGFFSQDPNDPLNLAGTRRSAAENKMPRLAVAEEAAHGKARLIKRTVQRAKVGVIHRWRNRSLCREQRAMRDLDG